MRSEHLKTIPQLLLCGCVAVIAACGGGGGSSGTDANQRATTGPTPSTPTSSSPGDKGTDQSNAEPDAPAWFCPAEPIDTGADDGAVIDLAVSRDGVVFQLRRGAESAALTWQEDVWQEVWRDRDFEPYAIEWHDGALWIAGSLGLLSVAQDAQHTEFRLEQEVASMAVATLSDNTVLLALGPAGLFVSLDAGSSWQAGGFDTTYTLTGKGARVYAWKPDGLLVSVDGGESWTEVPLPRSGLAELVVDPRNSQYLLARWQDHRLSASLNGGIGWEDASPVEWQDISGALSTLVIGPFGDYYAVADGQVLCHSQLRLPEPGTLLTSPLGLSLLPHRVEDTAPKFQLDDDTDATVTVTVMNHSRQRLERVELELWSLAEPSEFYVAQSKAQIHTSLIGREVIGRFEPDSEVSVDIPWAAARRATRLHRLIALATAKDESPGGAMTPVAVVGPSKRVESVIDFDLADLETNIVYLNAATPYAIIETAVGEQRRVTINVWNRGPDPARNVVVSVPLSHVEVLQGQIFSGSGTCSREVDAFICRAPVLHDGATLGIELNIRPRYYLTAMPYTVTSDTDDPDEILMPREHHDMRMELINVNGGSVQPGDSVLIDMRARNAGLEPTDEVVLHGFAGPWPQVTQADVNLQTNSCAMVQPSCEGSSCQDPATHPALFTCRVQASSFGGLQPGHAIGSSYDIIAPAGGPVALGVWTAAEGMEWNTADNAAAVVVDVVE